MSGVLDIFDDILNGLLCALVVCHSLSCRFYIIGGGRVVLSAKLGAYSFKGKLGHFLYNVCGDYSCCGYLRRSFHAPDIIGGNAIYSRNVVYYPVNGNGRGGIVAEYFPDGVLRLGHGRGSSYKVLISFELFHAALKLPDICFEPCGNALNNVV